MTEQIEVRGGTLAVERYGETSGSAAPVALVHGLGYSSDVWREVAEHLASSTHVVAFDLRGHGLSDASPESAEDLWHDVPELVERLGLQRPVLVGHDYGGHVVVAAAAENPDRYSGVVVVDWPTVLPHDEAAAWLAEVTGTDVIDFMTERFSLGAQGPDAATRESFLDDLVERVGADWMTSETGRENARSGLARSVLVRPDGSWVRRPTRDELLAAVRIPEDSPVFPDVDVYDRITCPVWFIHPGQGMYADVLPRLEEVAKAPGRRLDVVHGTHHIHQTHPEVVASIVEELVQQVSPA